MEYLSRQVLLSLVFSFVADIHGFKLTNLPLTRNTPQEETHGERRTLKFKQELPALTRVSDGRSVALQCEAGGRPVPTIHWLYKESRIPQSASHSYYDDEAFFEQSHGAPVLQLGSTISRLHLDCMSRQEAGQYACVAETPTERNVSYTFIEVDPATGIEDRSQCAEETLLEGIPARIYMWQTHRLEFEGSDVQVYCRANGYPMPKVTWYDNYDEIITKGNRNYRLLKNGDLLIKNISWLNMGQYKCRAHNKYGEDEATMFLYPTLP